MNAKAIRRACNAHHITTCICIKLLYLYKASRHILSVARAHHDHIACARLANAKAFSRSRKDKYNSFSFSQGFSISIRTMKMASVGLESLKVNWLIIRAICWVTFILEEGNYDTCDPISSYVSRVHNGIQEIC